jgi:IMP cyclohydrolase
VSALAGAPVPEALRALAEENFRRHVVRNRYPGRGIVLGRAADGEAWLQVFWIMGRSENSRNRVFVAEGTTLRTEPFDASAVSDPSLILYEAMLEVEGVHIVTNGDHTRTIAGALAQGGSFESALAAREREPDAPHYTPRIGGVIDLRGGEPRFALGILKAHAADPALTDRATFRPAPPPPGLGLGLSTYRGDGDPLPPFAGEPLWLPLPGDAEAVLAHYWQGLEAAHRVAVAVKRIPLRGGPAALFIHNRHADRPTQGQGSLPHDATR